MARHFENAETSEVPVFMTGSGLGSAVGSDAKRIRRMPDAILITKCRRLPLFKVDPESVEHFRVLRAEIYGSNENENANPQ
jgi:hypothetical protein